jgi:hypothetical protein
MTDDKTKRDKRDRNAVSADAGCELEYFARRNGLSMDEARALIGQFGDRTRTPSGNRNLKA